MYKMPLQYQIYLKSHDFIKISFCCVICQKLMQVNVSDCLLLVPALYKSLCTMLRNYLHHYLQYEETEQNI
jgi:hypothetical protein